VGYKRGYSNGLSVGRDKGFAEGKQKGFAEGHEKGLKEGFVLGYKKAYREIIKCLKNAGKCEFPKKKDDKKKR